MSANPPDQSRLPAPWIAGLVLAWAASVALGFTLAGGRDPTGLVARYSGRTSLLLFALACGVAPWLSRRAPGLVARSDVALVVNHLFHLVWLSVYLGRGAVDPPPPGRLLGGAAGYLVLLALLLLHHRGHAWAPVTRRLVRGTAMGYLTIAFVATYLPRLEGGGAGAGWSGYAILLGIAVAAALSGATAAALRKPGANARRAV